MFRICRHLASSTFILLLGLIIVRFASAAPPTTTPVEGLRENTPAVFALTNLKIVPEPGKSIDRGTIVIRDGVIEAVGPDVKPPADARVFDLGGKTAYAGFIDAYSEIPTTGSPQLEGAAHWNPQVTPQVDAARYFSVAESHNEKLRAQGITARLVAPEGRIVKGQSIVVSTGSTTNPRTILKSGVAQHFRLTVGFGGGRENYPNSPMGAIALARQTLIDAEWHAKAWAAWKGNTQLPRPEQNKALEALATCLAGNQPAIIDAANEEFFLRADRFAREFGLTAIIRGSGREYRRLDEVRATGRAVIVPVNFPQPPNVATIEESLDVSLEQLMHWDHAPENAARLDAAGVPIALTAHGLRESMPFLNAVRRAVERGLSADSALKALTITPANLLGLGDRLGKVAPGMLGNLVIADGDLFSKKTKVVETWVDGRRFEIDKLPVFDVRGEWSLEVVGSDDRVLRLTLKISGSPKQLAGKLSKVVGEGEKAEEIKLEHVSATEAQLSFRLEGKAFDREGALRGSATVSRGDEGQLTLLGTFVWSDGTSEKLTGTRAKEPSAADKKLDAEAKEDKPAKEDEDDEADDNKEKGDNKEKPETPAAFPVNFPLGDFGRTELPDRPKLLAIKNATLWTCGKDGLIEDGTLVIGEGKILAAGKDVTIPDGATVIDAAGKHISPGVIDCHSHMATDGGVNESSQAITAEVRIGDFVDSNDVTIYRQLAGGVTAANVLHGSANPIGGQNQVIKLRWGLTGEELKFKEAPPGIKFALGENVKQSNWGDEFNTRYPQTRMGVEQIIRDAFAAAIDYKKSHDRWNTDHAGLPPRRDLELDALAEVVQGKRWIHCHSYRQDEILALVRVCDHYGITIGSLQHILEGYKVADVMAKHGATGSAFSDWWAYKYEVIDAIPYNGALMHRQGIIVSFNSDDAELGRHLNHEAAKAVKYGGVAPEEALKFVTLNPARQLRIDTWVGSLEPGKHADFVVWSGPPLAVTSRCQETWIDGRKFFDRDGDQSVRKEQLKMRARLIRKVLESGQTMQKAGERQPDDSELWPRFDEFCAHGSRGR